VTNPLLLSGIFDIGAKLIDRILPDKEAAANAKLKLLELDQSGELARMASDEKLMLAQVEVNKLDAQSSSNMQRNWRPFIGWMCGFGFGYEFLLKNFIIYFTNLYLYASGAIELIPDIPSLDAETLTALTVAMLGLGVYRTTEKVRGVVK
jgi:hypothetical protein